MIVLRAPAGWQLGQPLTFTERPMVPTTTWSGTTTGDVMIHRTLASGDRVAVAVDREPFEDGWAPISVALTGDVTEVEL